jgi:hypothetical protein
VITAPKHIVEAMAEASWNRHASVPWREFMAAHPGSKEAYLEQMRAALAAVRFQDLVPERPSVLDGHEDHEEDMK